VLDYKYEPQYVLENSNYKIYYDKVITLDQTLHNSRPDIHILDKIIEDALLINIAISSTQSLHSTITEKLQKYTDLKEELTECGN
jgi:hypothetical protein